MWLYGIHPVISALNNPKRRVLRLVCTEQSLGECKRELKTHHPKPQIVQIKEFEKLLERGAVHQGIAIEVEPLKTLELEQITGFGSKPLLILDQVTDPHNVGAMLRSAAAFDVAAIISQDRHSPNVTGTLAKAASGALELVPMVNVTNISKTIDELKQAGYWVAGLDGATQTHFKQAKLSQKTALVLGAEGKGLRRLVAEHCDVLVKIPMSSAMESLNVSNAAAIALYELFQSEA